LLRHRLHQARQDVRQHLGGGAHLQRSQHLHQDMCVTIIFNVSNRAGTWLSGALV
jgi:hypothetical protein